MPAEKATEILATIKNGDYFMCWFMWQQYLRPWLLELTGLPLLQMLLTIYSRDRYERIRYFDDFPPDPHQPGIDYLGDLWDENPYSDPDAFYAVFKNVETQIFEYNNTLRLVSEYSEILITRAAPFTLKDALALTRAFDKWEDGTLLFRVRGNEIVCS